MGNQSTTDFNALVAVLDPDVVVRIDAGTKQPAASMVINGAPAVATQALRGLRTLFARPTTHLRPVLVNGAAGVVVTMDGQPITVMGFTIAKGKIVDINAIADPERVHKSQRLSSPTASLAPAMCRIRTPSLVLQRVTMGPMVTLKRIANPSHRGIFSMMRHPSPGGSRAASLAAFVLADRDLYAMGVATAPCSRPCPDDLLPGAGRVSAKPDFGELPDTGFSASS